MNPNQKIVIEPTITYSVKVYEGVKLVKAACNFDNFEEAYAKMKDMELELSAPQDISPEEKTKIDKDYCLAKIEAAAAKIKNTEKEKEKEHKKKHNEAKEKILQLAPRINNLLKLVNTCLKNNIRPYKKDPKNRNRDIFSADGIYHHTGFINLRYKEVTTISYIGIINGGACGNTDLQVNKYGNAVGIYNDNSKNKNIKVDVPPRLEDMEKFLKEFDYFEKEFLAYIYNL